MQESPQAQAVQSDGAQVPFDGALSHQMKFHKSLITREAWKIRSARSLLLLTPVL